MSRQFNGYYHNHIKAVGKITLADCKRILAECGYKLPRPGYESRVLSLRLHGEDHCNVYIENRAGRYYIRIWYSFDYNENYPHTIISPAFQFISVDHARKGLE